MTEQNSWNYPRTDLAQNYLALLKDGAGTPLCLYNYRQIGKTHFITNDLIPLARKKGYVPIYIDLWQDKPQPIHAILDALENALDDLHLPKTKLGNRLATPIKKISLFGAGVDFGESPTRKKPNSPYLQIGFLAKEIMRVTDKPILLLIDEIQQLAVSREGEAIVAALRSTLTKHRGRLFAVFTGSSQERLNELFMRAKAPLYHFASQIVFPLLNEEFVNFIAAKYENVTRKKLDKEKLLQAFQNLDYRPGVFVDLVIHMMKDGQTAIDRYLHAYRAQQASPKKWMALWGEMKPFERLILKRLALGQTLSSKDALLHYAKELAIGKVSPGSISHAIKKLKAEQIIFSSGARGQFRFETEDFAKWIKQSFETN